MARLWRTALRGSLDLPIARLSNNTAGEVLPPSKALTGPATPGRSVCAPTAAAFIGTQTAPERRWIMKARSTKLAVEMLEDRCVPATVAYGDLNHDGLADMAAITSPTAITVSLANADGSYTVAAVLTAPAKQPVQDVYLGDHEGDGDLDISAVGEAGGNKWYAHHWLGNGDGTFGSMTTSTGRWWKLHGAINWI